MHFKQQMLSSTETPQHLVEITSPVRSIYCHSIHGLELWNALQLGPTYSVLCAWPRELRWGKGPIHVNPWALVYVYHGLWSADVLLFQMWFWWHSPVSCNCLKLPGRGVCICLYRCQKWVSPNPSIITNPSHSYKGKNTSNHLKEKLKNSILEFVCLNQDLFENVWDFSFELYIIPYIQSSVIQHCLCCMY